MLVSHRFPPYNTMGAVRTGKMAKYWVRQGHDVRVLSASEQGYSKTLPVELDEERVRRTPWVDINGVVAGFFSRNGTRGKSSTETEPGTRGPLKYLTVLYRSVFNFPDGQVGWYLPAVRAGRELMENWRPDAIYASAPAYTSLVVAARLSQIYNIPWIAEFRDLWTDNHYRPYGQFRTRIDRLLERRVVSRARGLVTVSEPFAESLRTFYGSDIEVIRNGYDPEDFAKLTQTPRNRNILRIVHTGSVYAGKRDPTPLFAALKQLGEKAINIRVEFYGRYLGPIREAAEKYGVGDLVITHGDVAYEQSLHQQVNADALLLLLWDVPSERGVYPGKLFEYVGAKRPILAIGPPDNVAVRLINKRSLGFCGRTPDQVAEALGKLLKGVIKRGATRYYEDLTRPYQAQRAANFIKKLIT